MLSLEFVCEKRSVAVEDSERICLTYLMDANAAAEEDFVNGFTVILLEEVLQYLYLKLVSSGFFLTKQQN